MNISKKAKSLVLPAIVSAAVLTAGSLLIMVSRAASPAVSVEAENAAVTAPAAIIPDTTASAGRAVRFGSGAQPPAQCASGGAYLWGNLAACGWPDASNTGAQPSGCPGGSLSLNSGSPGRRITLSTQNSSLSCQDVTGCLYVTGTNVLIKNVKISCDSGKTGTAANGTAAIFIESGASVTIDHVEINGNSGVHACIWHQGASAAASAVNCHGADDGFFSWGTGSSPDGNNFTVRDSYFHDFTVKTANGHIDGYQTEGASSGLIEHNTYYMTSDQGNDSDSAIAIWNGNKSSDSITVRNNLITGGGFAVYAEDYNPSEASPAGGYAVTNIVFTNNSFSTRLFGGTCVGTYGVWYSRGSPSDQWRRSGNKVLETGYNLDNGNPPGCS